MAEAFDPDQYLKEKTQSAPSQAFDPDAYLKSKGVASPPEERPAFSGPTPGLSFSERMAELPSNIRRDAAAVPGVVLKAGKTLAEPVIRALDVPAGLTRAGLAGIGGLIAGKTIVKPEDITAAAVGKGPSSSEYMERAGVPEMGRLGPVTGRGALGFATDVATDPLGLVAKSAKEAGLLSKEFRPVGELTNEAGKSTYKSGFKKIDERLAEKGKTPFSDILLSEGAPTGTTKAISEKAGDIAERVSKERAGLYDKANQTSGPVTLSGITFPKAEQRIAKLRQSRFSSDKALADDLEKTMTELKSSPASLENLSSIKSDLYDKLPESAFSGGQVRGDAKKFNKDLASDIRQTIIDQGNKSEPGLGSNIDNLNDKWSSLITAEKPTAMQIRRGETPNFGTSIDAMLLGTGHGAALPIKKAADLAKTTYARTNLGKGLMDLGETQVPDAIARRGLINRNK